jgi:hypothetical protein
MAITNEDFGVRREAQHLTGQSMSKAWLQQKCD